MFAGAAAWLEKNAHDIDELNVFPVPDGDTGTNMLLTRRSSVEEAYRAPDNSASTVAKAMAKGALLGARGNSGVILSEIFRGMSEDLADKEVINGDNMAKALSKGSETAYKGFHSQVIQSIFQYQLIILLLSGFLPILLTKQRHTESCFSTLEENKKVWFCFVPCSYYSGKNIPSPM